MAFAGEMTFEFTVHDAQTAELLVAGADRRVGGQNLIDKELFNPLGGMQKTAWSFDQTCPCISFASCARRRVVFNQKRNSSKHEARASCLKGDVS